MRDIRDRGGSPAAALIAGRAPRARPSSARAARMRDAARKRVARSGPAAPRGRRAQVRRLRDALRAAGLAEVPVGTVDKFQGREAPVVFYSMATSSAEEVPRTLEFLFSRNRLNVAVSRAMCLAFVVASPLLARVPRRDDRADAAHQRAVPVCGSRRGAGAVTVGRRRPDTRRPPYFASSRSIARAGSPAHRQPLCFRSHRKRKYDLVAS